MATIEKRERPGGTYYRVRIRIKGFPPQQKTFTRRTDAKLWAQQTETAIRKGEFQNIIKTANSKTLKDVIVRYREEVMPHKAATTQRAQKTYLTYWESELGEYAISYIEPELIGKKLAALAKAGDTRLQLEKGQKPPRPKSRKTLKHYRDLLDQLFKRARQWGWMATNPLEGVDRITKIRDERNRFLDDDERKALLAACKTSDNKQLYPIVVFALSTGARKGEILKLAPSDVNLDRDTAILRDTKNGETRSVSVVHHLNEVLKDQLENSASFYEELGYETPERFLFPRRDGLAAIDIRKAWENARKEAGIKDFRFHDLRHSTASYLAMQGANALEIADMLGHKTLQMVKRYSHLSESHTRGLAKNLSEKIF